MHAIDYGDTIFLTDLRVRAIIGINDWERKVRQTVSIDLAMPADARHAAKSDDIADTVNYKAVAKRLIAYVAESEFQLVETLSERIAEIVLKEYKLPWVRVGVHKPGAVRGAKDVGITIRRGDFSGLADTQKAEIFVGVGSNVQPEHYIGMALSALETRFGSLRRSTVYRNAAVGFDGDDFLNMVVGFESSEDMRAISAALARIEQECGRERSGIRFAPRTMDLDLLMFGQQVIDDPEFVLPRPEILQHAFILRPLAEVAGNVVHPVEKRSLAQIWRDSDYSDHNMKPVEIIFE